MGGTNPTGVKWVLRFTAVVAGVVCGGEQGTRGAWQLYTGAMGLAAIHMTQGRGPSSQLQTQRYLVAQGAACSVSCSSLLIVFLLPPWPAVVQLTLLQKLVQQQASAACSTGDATPSPMASLRTSAATPPPSVLAAAAQPGIAALAPAAAAAEAAASGGAAATLSQKGQTQQHWSLTRAADCFREGVVLVDASSPTWELHYANDAFCSSSGGCCSSSFCCSRCCCCSC